MTVKVESQSKCSVNKRLLLGGAEVEAKEFKEGLEPGHIY